MKVRRVRIHRRPGIPEGFGVELGTGLNVLQGTNGSGKTSLCRTVFEVLWNDREFRGAAEVELEVNGRTMLATREGGEDTHWSGGQPALPGSSQRRTFFLGIDDLFDAHGDEELATAVRRELGRGFDLATPLVDERRLTGASQQAHAARRSVQKAADAHRSVAQAQDLLDVEAHELRARKDEVARARKAGDELVAVENALAALVADQRVRSLTVSLGDFPEGIERVHPRADRDLEEREAVQDRARQSVEETEARLGAARARAAATGLPGEGLSDEELDVLDKAGQTLIKARERRDRVASSLASSSKLLAELSGAGLPEAAPTREDIQSLEEGLKMLRRAESRVIEQGAYVDAMTGEEGDELSPKIALAQQFVRLVVFLACVQIAAGVYLKDQGLPGILLLAGGALTLILAWCIRAPLAELRGLTAERDVLRRAAERRLARDERLAEEAKQAQSTRLEEFGLDAAWGGLDLVNLEARLAQRREAQTSLVESRASLEESEEQELLARQSLARVIDPLMEALVIDGEVRRGALSEDAAALLQVTERLRGREAERRRAADSIPELEARREAGQREVEEAARALRRFFQENGVPDGDVAGLRERLAAHPRWREMSEALRDAERDARDGRDALGSSEALLGEQMDVLEARARELRETRDRRDELVSQVAELQLRLDQTSRGNALAEARRAERAARAQLAGMRDTALIGAAANVLLSDVEEEHRREVRDGVVPRASRAFARFTDGEYRLEAPLASSREAAGEAALGCVVRSSETGLLVAPSSLSNGTRAQLLLALRVALAEELEGPDPLPLFLDEVLATSDPRRLEAVVKSLAELVMAGRQVILLTADPVVAARVTDALGTDQELLRIVDVDAARDRDAMILTAKELVAPRMRANPDPSAFASAEDYAEAIGVAQADPFQQAASLHPFHLLRDELPAVQALRSHHLESSGRALRALDDELPHGLAQGQAELLRRRVLLAQAFLDAWRVGRMPKLRTEFLRGSALKRSGKYVGAVLDVAADLDWDGRALIDALTTRSDPRLKGFRQTITEDLRAELEAAGYWTDATPLQGAELQREALERASTSGIAADPRELERLSTWLLV